jgi:hypothetical protein
MLARALARATGLATVAAAAALFAVAPAPQALASPSQESWFQDDSLLVYGTPAGVARTLDTLRSLGVDRIRVSVFWAIVAPDSASKSRPSFDAADPAAYPPGAWDRYDRLVRLAGERGIAVNFDVTSPAPYWATGRPPRDDLEKNFEPSPAELELFVRALGTRYSGTYVEKGNPAPPPQKPPGIPIIQTHGEPRAAAPAGEGDAAPIPRVTSWSVWNEPNQPGWLTPQWAPASGSGSPLIERAPSIYRNLVDASFRALQATGHGGDAFLVGELAPKGANPPRNRSDKPVTRQLSPLRFLRRLYCLDDRMRFYKGAAAAARGCPVGDQVKQFTADHPGLFALTGIAHHPYGLLERPDQHTSRTEDVPLADLARLQRTMTAIFKRYGKARKKSVPIYLTEYGYQTNPPDPTQPWSPSMQSVFLNQAEFMTWRLPYVRAMTQFLLRDDAPDKRYPNESPNHWATFQSGLQYLDGRSKPAFSTYRLPIWVPKPTVRRGRPVRVWALLRAAPNGTAQQAVLEFRRGSRGPWKAIATLKTSSYRGYVDRAVRVPASGAVRVTWRGEGSRTIRSRAVAVRVR